MLLLANTTAAATADDDDDDRQYHNLLGNGHEIDFVQANSPILSLLVL